MKKGFIFWLVVISISTEMIFESDIILEGMSVDEIKLGKEQGLREEINKLNDKPLETLMYIVGDENNPLILREAAATILGDRGDKKAIPVLETLFNYRPRIVTLGGRHGFAQQAAAKSIVKIEMEKGLSNIEKAIFLIDLMRVKCTSESPAGGSRGVGAFLLLKDLCKDKNIIPIIMKTLKDENPYVQERAIRLLRENPDERAVEPLIELLKSNNVDIKRAAVEALGKIGDPRTIEPLIAALRDDNVSRVRKQAADTLAEISKENFGEDHAKRQE